MSTETFGTIIRYFCIKTLDHIVWVQLQSFLCPYCPFHAKMSDLYHFGTKIGTFGFPKCKHNVILQIQTKISFKVQNKPRVIIWTQMRDFEVKTCEEKVFE